MGAAHTFYQGKSNSSLRRQPESSGTCQHRALYVQVPGLLCPCTELSSWKCREECCCHLRCEFLEHTHRTRETSITQVNQPYGSATSASPRRARLRAITQAVPSISYLSIAARFVGFHHYVEQLWSEGIGVGVRVCDVVSRNGQGQLLSRLLSDLQCVAYDLAGVMLSIPRVGVEACHFFAT